MNYRPSGYRVSNATDSSGSASNARSPNTVPANFTVHDLAFDFPLGWGPKENRTGKDINPRSYIDASITELFFTCNEVHDLFYRYGFDEVSGNFQEHNFGRGGLGSDAVIANAQDGSGMDNANFATPPDGQRPRMRMYGEWDSQHVGFVCRILMRFFTIAVWDGPKPWRDGDLEAGIVIHE
jgi:extracellular elastinolytic metalloproteinase